MFGKKKQERNEIETVIAELKKVQEQQGNAQERLTETLKGLGQELTGCRELIDTSGKDMARQLKRHSEAIEDLLEERKSQDAVVERYENQIGEGEERENALLALLCRYQEELSLVEEKMCTVNQSREYTDDWAKQFTLFRKSLEGELRRCSMEETGRPGEQADYRYHEILDAEDTVNPEQNGTVSHCYRPGCVYRGKVVTRAQVRVYRFTGQS